MKYLFLATLLFLSACTNSKEKTETIKVSGEGKIRVKPNQVIFTISVLFVQPKMVDAVRLTQGTVDLVVAILSKYGDKDNDIKTSSISANKEYEYRGNRSVFLGFQAQQSIDFVLNDINKFTDLTGELLATKISSISQIQFGHSKTDSIFREADLLAYDDALISANKLADRAGVKLGKVVYITNTEEVSSDYGFGAQDVMYESVQTYNKGFGGGGFRISPQVMEFKRRIIAGYEIND